MRISDWSSDVCSSDLHRQRLTAPAGRVDEDAAQIASPVAALLHAQRHALAELGKLPHLYACAERTGAKLEPEALIGIAGIGLDIAEDSEIEQRERAGIAVWHPEQPPVRKADRKSVTQGTSV